MVAPRARTPPSVKRRRARLSTIQSDINQQDKDTDTGSKSIAMSLSLTVSTDLHHVVAVISERTSSIGPVRLQRLKAKDWGEKAIENNMRFTTAPTNATGPSSGPTNRSSISSTINNIKMVGGSIQKKADGYRQSAMEVMDDASSGLGSVLGYIRRTSCFDANLQPELKEDDDVADVAQTMVGTLLPVPVVPVLPSRPTLSQTQEEVEAAAPPPLAQVRPELQQQSDPPHQEPEWTEVGRSEIIESIAEGVTTSFLFSLCTALREDNQSEEGGKNDRHIAIYHVPSLGTDCHPVDHFVPVGYSIVDLNALMVGNSPKPGKGNHHKRTSTQLPPNWNKYNDGPAGQRYYWNAATQESSWDAPDGSSGGSADGNIQTNVTTGLPVLSSTTLSQRWQRQFPYEEDEPQEGVGEKKQSPPLQLGQAQCTKKLQNFQHLSIDTSNPRGSESKKEQQQQLDDFVCTLALDGIQGRAAPRGSKCIVRISPDKKSLVVEGVTSKYLHRKAKTIQISLQKMLTVCMFNDMTTDAKKSLPKKMSMGSQTNEEVGRTCHMLLRNQTKGNIVLIHYLLQFRTQPEALYFVQGMRLLLKTRSLKVMGTIQINVQHLPHYMNEYRLNQFPQVDHMTWNLGRTNNGFLIVHEELIESPVALSVPVLFLKSIVLPELLETINSNEIELTTAVSARRKIVANESMNMSGFSNLTEQVGRLERELSLGKDILHQIQREITLMKQPATKTFRPSSDKKEHSLRFVPLNCHSHRIQHNDGSYDAIVTSGAHCAHSFGFKHGGLLTLLDKHRKTTQQSIAVDALGQSSLINGSNTSFNNNSFNNTSVNNNSFNNSVDGPLPHAVDTSPLPSVLFHRLSVCVSQSLAALLTSLMFDVVNHCNDAQYFQRLEHCGYLCHFECLLSTAGDENGMLDDHIVAIHSLNQVTIEVYTGHMDGGATYPATVTSIEGSLQGKMIVRIDAGCQLASTMGRGREGMGKEKRNPSIVSFGVYSVLISQGINEQQTIANAVGNAGRQLDINNTGIQRMGQ